MDNLIIYNINKLKKHQSYYTTTHSYSDKSTHIHENFWEIIYQVRGITKNIINGEIYYLEPHNILIMPPKTKHLIEFQDNNSLERDIYCEETKMKKILELYNEDLFNELNNRPTIFAISQTDINYLEDIFFDFSFFQLPNNKLELLHTTAISYFVSNLVKQRFCTTNITPFWIKQLIENIINCENFEELNVENIVKTVNYSYGHISREFKKYTNMTVKSFILQAKLKKAISFLKTDYSIYQISEKLGFESATGFIKAFKQYYLITPHQYKTKYLSPAKID